jgi:hypothetical protein
MLKTKGFDNLPHAWDEQVIGLVNLLRPLEVGSLRTVKHKEGKKRCFHELRTPKEKCSQNGIFSLFPVFCVKEPDTGVNANSVRSDPLLVPLKALRDCQFSQGSWLCCWPENLNIVQSLVQANG